MQYIYTYNIHVMCNFATFYNLSNHNFQADLILIGIHEFNGPGYFFLLRCENLFITNIFHSFT